MKNTRRKLLSLLLAVVMVLTVVPVGLMTGVFAAEPVSYMDYDTATNTFTEKTIDTYNKVEASTTTLTGGWWVVDGTVETAGLTCSGDVNLILTDGSSLTVTGKYIEGISSQYPITIYGQINSTGKLTVKATGYDANTYESYYGLTISSKLTVNGGNVSVTGSDGDNNDIGINGGNGIYCYDSITVNGGNLSAVGGSDGWLYAGEGIHCSRSITINGGNLSATAGNANLGGGIGINASDITINGGTVKAVGGNTESEDAQNNAGGGIFARAKLLINGGNVTAIGGIGQNNNNGSGIKKLNNNSVYIDKYSTVKADNNATPTTVIEHESDTNLASSLDGKQYVTVTEPDGTRITSDMVSDIPTLIYSNAALEPAVIVTDGDETLVEGEDYSVNYRNNLYAGTATATVNGIGDYYGEVIKEFTIKKRSVTITSFSDTKTYDGKPLTNGDIGVSGDGFVGDDGATYDITGSQTNAGVSDNTFTYELNGLTDENNYDIKVIFGELTVTPKALNASMISGVYNASYTGKPIVWNIVVKDGDKTLAEITDYTVSYKDNTNAGTASVTITGIGNYGGTVTEKFTISPAAQSAPTGITSTDETKCSASDGTISGLTTAMEISSDGKSYAPCTGTKMTGLAHGTYYIRYAGSTNYTASDSTQIEIKNGDCYGGTATCVSKAVCDGCHNEYGELGAHCYEWKSDDAHYWQKCKYCNEETQKKDLPSVTLNCPERICADQIPEITFTVPEGWKFRNIVIGSSMYGEDINISAIDSGVRYKIDFNDSGNAYILNRSVQTAVDVHENTIYCWLCISPEGDNPEYCFRYKIEKAITIQAEHSGGTATETKRAVCDVCGKEYGELAPKLTITADSNVIRRKGSVTFTASTNVTGGTVVWYNAETGAKLGEGTSYTAEDVTTDLSVYAVVCKGTTEISRSDTVSVSVKLSLIEKIIYDLIDVFFIFIKCKVDVFGMIF